MKIGCSSLFINIWIIPVNVMNGSPVEVHVHLQQVTDLSDGNRNLYSACALCVWDGVQSGEGKCYGQKFHSILLEPAVS